MKDKVLAWLKAALVRAIKTAAEAAVALIGTNAVTMGEVDWMMVASGACLLAVMSLLTSLAGLPEVEDGASLPKLAKSGE